MSTKYGIFGALDKEPPQLTTARSILGLGRDADKDEIKRTYRKLAMKWHPDKNYGKPTEQEATQKMALYISAYELLTDTEKRKEAEQAFQKALNQPFSSGNRVFCLGSLYGHRIYIPQGSAVITDTNRLLTGEKSDSEFIPQKHHVIYGVRSSILDSELSDLLYTFYSGNNLEELSQGFHTKEYGGLDDLPWIRNNDKAVDHFLNRRFKQAAFRMNEADRACPRNVIFMYRHGVCLEAFAAENRPKKQEWKSLVNFAVNLYESCLEKLKNRRVWEEKECLGRKRDVLVEKPESQLTILMQLADAYAELGNYSKSRKIWIEVRKIDPDCYEAREKGKNIFLALPVMARRAFKLLPESK